MADDMTNLAANLTLYSSTSLKDALDLPVSIASGFFDCKAFDNWKQSRENEAKTQAGVVNRLNEVIRGIGVLSKIMNKFLSRRVL
jgi:hypothetical protein